MIKNDSYLAINIYDESGYLSVKYVGTMYLKLGYIITEVTYILYNIYLIRYITQILQKSKKKDKE